MKRKAKRGRTFLAPLLVAAAALLPGSGASGASSGGGSGEQAVAMHAAAREAFALVNAHRLAHGLKPLEASARCVAAAQSHAESQAGREALSHDGDAESFTERMGRWGLLRWAVAENLGRGPTPSAVVDAWMKSQPHRENVLSPSYVSAGVGFAADTYTLCLSGGGGS